ncbi:MAG: PIN domain-containing protein [Desulfobulbaceae bacterium]|jgi:predicted nucleic acid-binding protein|nr:PIN domain-containing protein [Desulfobulbaceae bacterium]
MNGKHFIDSNVWIYFLTDDDPEKKERVGAMLAEARRKVVSWQVVNEVCANLIRKKGQEESLVGRVIDFMCGSCEVVDCSRGILEQASSLRSGHSVSFWDSLVVAAAISANCDVLVSKDMQDGKKFGRLSVQNIFT